MCVYCMLRGDSLNFSFLCVCVCVCGECWGGGGGRGAAGNLGASSIIPGCVQGQIL